MHHQTTTIRRAAIYARYSTDMQRERSIDDQVALCREYARKNGLRIIQSYSDRAQTSASLVGREGIMSLIDDAKARKFDVVIVEALDRISRDQEDLAGVFKRLSFANVEIVAVHEGVADAVQVGIRGLLGSMFLSDLKHKVRRGMAGVVNDGRVAGGNAYGYDVVPGKPGERTINEEQAAVIRRIFREYVDGASPRDIAGRLNAEGVPPPRGSKWNASTINGSKNRSYGILVNALYNGQIVWNRVHMVRDPDTGKRVSRFNPESDWKIAEAPHLAIVDRETYNAAQARKADRTRLVEQGASTKKAKRLLSGLLRCSSCGSGMASVGFNGGRLRVQCSQNRESGSCDNNRKYNAERIEHAVVTGILSKLEDEEAAERYIRDYVAERRTNIDSATRSASQIEAKLARVAGEQERLITLFQTGVLDLDRVKPRLTELEDQRKALEEEAASAREAVPVIELHPAAVERFIKLLSRAKAEYENYEMLKDPEKIEAMRELISHVIVSDSAANGYELDVFTYLSALTGDYAPGGLGGALVAEEGFEPPTQGL